MPLKIFVLDDEINTMVNGEQKYYYFDRLQNDDLVEFNGATTVHQALQDFGKSVPDIALIDINMGSDNKVFASWEIEGTGKYEYKGADTIIGGLLFGLVMKAQPKSIVKIFTGREEQLFTGAIRADDAIKAIYILSAELLKKLGIQHFAIKGGEIQELFKIAVKEWRDMIIDPSEGTIAEMEAIQNSIRKIEEIVELIYKAALKSNFNVLDKAKDKIKSLFLKHSIGFQTPNTPFRELKLGSIFSDKYMHYLDDIIVVEDEPGLNRLRKDPTFKEMRDWLLHITSGSYQVKCATQDGRGMGMGNHFKFKKDEWEEALKILEPFFRDDEVKEVWSVIKSKVEAGFSVSTDVDLHKICLEKRELKKCSLYDIFKDDTDDEGLRFDKFFRMQPKKFLESKGLDCKEGESYYVYGNTYFLKKGFEEVVNDLQADSTRNFKIVPVGDKIILVLWDNGKGISHKLSEHLQYFGRTARNIREYLGMFADKITIFTQTKGKKQAYEIKYDNPQNPDVPEFSDFFKYITPTGTLYKIEFSGYQVNGGR